MGFNKCFLPPIDSMKNDILINGLNQFIKKYGKYDALIGETDRMDFLKQIMENDMPKYLY
jgi:hypothetical protein